MTKVRVDVANFEFHRAMSGLRAEFPKEMAKADISAATDAAARARRRAAGLGGIWAEVAGAIRRQGSTIVLNRKVHGAVVAAEFGRDWLDWLPHHRKRGLMLISSLIEDRTSERYSRSIRQLLGKAQSK